MVQRGKLVYVIVDTEGLMNVDAERHQKADHLHVSTGITTPTIPEDI